MSLIEQLRLGDMKSLEMLVIECKDVCLNHLYSKTRCTKDEAVEIFTEAVVVLGEKVVAGKIDKIINIQGYMAGMCYNMWLNNKKVQDKALNCSSDLERFYYEVYDEHSGEQLSEFKEKLYDISEKALASLSDKCQQLIKYFYLEERRMSEIAAIMGFANEETAKASKYKCFKRLREQVSSLEQIIN